MDGTIRTVAQVDASEQVLDSLNLLETPTLVVRCSRKRFEIGELDVYIAFDTRLFGDRDAEVRYKIDDGVVVVGGWSVSHSRSGLFYEHPWVLAGRLKEGGTFHFDVLPAMHTRQYTSFTLRGSAAAIDRVLSACKLPDDEISGYFEQQIAAMRAGWQNALSVGIVRYAKDPLLRQLGGDLRRGIWNGLLEYGYRSGEPIRAPDEPPATANELLKSLELYLRATKVCLYDYDGFAISQKNCPQGFEAYAWDDFEHGRAPRPAEEHRLLDSQTEPKSPAGQLICANGHEYASSSGFEFCPKDGLALEQADPLN